MLCKSHYIENFSELLPRRRRAAYSQTFLSDRRVELHALLLPTSVEQGGTLGYPDAYCQANAATMKRVSHGPRFVVCGAAPLCPLQTCTEQFTGRLVLRGSNNLCRGLCVHIYTDGCTYICAHCDTHASHMYGPCCRGCSTRLYRQHCIAVLRDLWPSQ